MTRLAAHHIDPDAADTVEAGLRRVMSLQRMCERALVEGDADERAAAAAILDYLDRTPEGGLEGRLGLTGPGHTGALRQYRQQRRDAALRAVWQRCWPDLNPCAAARVIARHWAQFAAWRSRQGIAASIPAHEPAATLHWLCDRGHIALSPDRIRKVLSEDRQKIGCLQTVETTTKVGQINEEDGDRSDK